MNTPLRAACYRVLKLATNKGIIARACEKDCERCGKPARDRHHDDYSKPLDVQYFCSRCHRHRHIELGWGRSDHKYEIKINAKHRAEILALDSKDTAHCDIADQFLISRERVRQICQLAGHPERSPRRQFETALRHSVQKLARVEARAIKKATPTDTVKKYAELWNCGLTLGQIASRLNNSVGSVGVIVTLYRRKWPYLFPYRSRPYKKAGIGVEQRRLK